MPTSHSSLIAALNVGAAAAALERTWNDVVTVLAEGTSDEPRAIEVLLRIADDPSRPRAVRDETLLARRRCADALGEIGNCGALDALEAAARSDPDGDLGWHARDAIANILHGGRGVSSAPVPVARVIVVT